MYKLSKFLVLGLLVFGVVYATKFVFLPTDYSKADLQSALDSQELEVTMELEEVDEKKVLRDEPIEESTLAFYWKDGRKAWSVEALSGVEMQYHEDNDEQAVKSFYEVVNSGLYLDKDWTELKEYKEENFVILKEGDEFSDIRYFPAVREMSRAGFAKYFVGMTDLQASDMSLQVFEDVDPASSYAKDIYALYDQGLVKDEQGKFRPEAMMTRGEALKIVMDFYEADFSEKIFGDSDVLDVDREDSLYFYVYTLYEQAGDRLSDLFRPNAPASDDFVKFLINEFGKNL